ncbi:MAG TPA: SRPBCC family protein [Chitinophagaceae bacterium]|nr:SRPBCC family protein [Chitinophagaceae bacterium]
MVIQIETTVNAPVDKVWQYWTSPEHITKWNQASSDWHTPWAKNDLVVGGQFVSRMEAKDGSMGFEFGGIYDEVVEHKKIAYTMGDGRKVRVSFSETAQGIKVVEEFDAEDEHSAEMQRQGWQAILDNFKAYTESQ